MTRAKRIEGKETGATVRGDEIIVAPIYADGLQDIISEKRALTELQENVLRYCHKQLVVLEKQRDQFWERMTDDLGLDKSVVYTLSGRVLTVVKDEPDAAPKK